MTNTEIAQEISNRIGTSPIPAESVYSMCYDIYQELGGPAEDFDDVYSILLDTLPLAQGKQDRLTAGQNITIDSANTISALGYKYDDTAKQFKTIAKMTSSSLIRKYSEEGNILDAGSESFIFGSRNVISASGETIGTGQIAVGRGNKITNTNFDGVAAVYGIGNIINHTNNSVICGVNSTVNGSNGGINQYIFGNQLTVNNAYEGAVGQYNVSHTGSTEANKTRFSIGCGKGVIGSTAIFMNYLEVMQNGDMYVNGIGGYDGVHIKSENSNVKTLQEYITSLESRLSALEGN